MERTPRIIRLGWTQFAVLGAVLASLMAVVFLVFPWDWEGLYVRYVALPRLESKFGFKCGNVNVHRPEGSVTYWGISEVTAGGASSRWGLRAGDVPFDHSGHGLATMYHAVVAAERGQFARFDVLSATDINAGREDGALRTVVINPPDTELAHDLFEHYRRELPAPTGDRMLRSVRQGDGRAELWVREVATDRQTMIHAFDLDVTVAWSAEGRWVAVADLGAHGSQCLLLDSWGGPPRDLSAAIARTDRATGKRMRDSKEVNCEVFGRVRGTSRIALIVSGYGGINPTGFRQDFFCDVAAGSVIAVR